MLSDGVIKIFPLPTSVAMATNFGTKPTSTRPPRKLIAPCLHLPPYTQLLGYRPYSVAMRQIPRSTERISSYCYTSPNIFITSDINVGR